SAGGTGTASFHRASPPSAASSLALPPAGRASLSLASPPSSRNWASQASISWALTSVGEILTFISNLYCATRGWQTASRQANGQVIRSWLDRRPAERPAWRESGRGAGLLPSPAAGPSTATDLPFPVRGRVRG